MSPEPIKKGGVAGLSLRAGSRGFSPATTSLSPATLIQNENIGKRKMHQITKL